MRFVEHRIGDPRILRLIGKWLKAGVWKTETYAGGDRHAPRGGNIPAAGQHLSPLRL